MNGKNLSLKLVCLAGAVAICVGALTMKGLKQGIDLRGGHRLVFEMIRNEDRAEKVRASITSLKEELAQATDDSTRKRLAKAIERQEQEITDLLAEGSADLAARMIPVLKRRVDPSGLRNLEWRPIGSNRIEVRMPAGTDESKRARRAYDSALQVLDARNLRRSQISQIEQAGPGAQREALIARFVVNDARLAGDVRAMGAAFDGVKEAEKNRSTDEPAFQNAMSAWEEARKRLTEQNLSRREVEGVLRRFLSPAAVEAIKNNTLQENAQRRLVVFQEELESLRTKYPARVAEIDQVVTCYKAWADVREFLDNPADLKRLIAKAGVLEFRIAPRTAQAAQEQGLFVSQSERRRYLKGLAEEGPEGAQRRSERYQWFAVNGDTESYGGLVLGKYEGVWYVLLSDAEGDVMLQQRGQEGWSLKRAYPTTADLGTPAVGFDFDQRGARQFAVLTEAHKRDEKTDRKGNHLAVVLDDEVYSAPTIKSRISGRGIISGRFSREEVLELVRTLDAGSLPARLKKEPVAENSFGPALGAVNRAMGIRAAYAGLIGVATFMLVYYLLSGVIAVVALMLNIIFVLGAMSVLNATFTLPGIAGLILTIGIAVDANVLIFERLREEQSRGQSVRMAIRNAYSKAFSAIFDANITTLIVCLILFWVGTDEIKGFGITLGFGVVFSMFTALVVTRWFFQLLLKMGLLNKPVFMLRLIGVPRVNWLGKRKLFWGISAVVIAIGVGSLIWQGSDIWGIELASGTRATVSLKDDALIDGKLPTDSLVRSQFRAATADEPDLDKLRATARVEMMIDPNRTESFLERNDADSDGKVSQAEWKAKRLDERFFALLDVESTDGHLDRDELEKLPETSYQVSTTEYRIARVKDTVRKAFGHSLRGWKRCTFELVKDGRVAQLGMDMPPDGLAKVRVTGSPSLRSLQQDYAGGAVMVVHNVSPALSVDELEARIREMRFQPDFARQRSFESAVAPLTEAGPGEYSSFAIFFGPGEEGALGTPEAWRTFAGNSQELLTAALHRAEDIVATNYDPAIAGESAQLAVVAVVLSWVAIVIYVWLRFGSAQWGLAAVLCLVHDVLVVVGLVAISGWVCNTALGSWLGVNSFKIDLAMIAAILTVIGYSVNDTIVVFDRIRENRGKLTTVSPQVINNSINQTLSRTLLTSGTTFIVVLIMYVWGGPGIHAFSYALLAGIIFGTYSSIAVASPLLLGFKQVVVAKITAATE